MKKNYTFIGRITAAALVGCAFTLATSCVNDEYSIDKEIDMDLNLGGSLSIPIGNTAPITLGEMIDEAIDTEDPDSYLKALSDGSYAISMKDEIDIDLSEISDTKLDPLSIPSGHQNIETEFQSMDFGSFNLDVAGTDIPVSTGLTTVAPAQSSISQDLSFQAGISDKLVALSSLIPGNTGGIQSGIPLPETTINLGSGVSQKIDLGMSGMSGCPTTVLSVSDIIFKDDVASIKLDVEKIADAFGNDFKMVIPSLTLSFPEDFILNCTEDGTISLGADKRTIKATNITLTKATPYYDITFTMESYNKTLHNNGGTLDAISGAIACNLSDSFTIQGTTNGSKPQDEIKISVNTSIEIEDMTLAVAGITIPVDNQENVGGSTKIYLGKEDLIKSITSVTLEDANAQNQIELDINSIHIIDGLTITGSDLEVWFPKENFNIAETNDITFSNGVYKLAIPLSDIIVNNGNNSAGFNSTITINELLFASPADGSDQIKKESAAGANYGEYYIELAPNISIKGGNVTMGGSVKLSDYNSFAAKYEDKSSPMYVGAQKISTSIKSVSPAGLAIASAKAEISGYTATLDKQSFAIKPDATEIDEAISKIYTLEVYNDDANSDGKVHVNFDISVNLDLSDNGAPVLSFENYQIMIPTFLKFAETLPTKSLSVEIDGKTVQREFQIVELDGAFTAKGGKCTFSKQLEIKGIDFTQYEGSVLEINPATGKQELALSDMVICEGGISIGQGDVDSSMLGDKISGEVTYSIDDMSIAKVSGIVKPEVQTGDEVIDLTEFTDELTGDVSLALTDPTITLKATNTFDIPLQITSLKLTTTRNISEPAGPDDEVETEVLETISLPEPIVIAPATNGATETSVYISANSVSGTDYDQYIQMEGLKNLLSVIPDNVEMSYAAEVVELNGHTHSIDLNRPKDDPYTFGIDYDLNIPLSFESFSFEYDTTIDGLNADLEEIIDFVDELDVKLEITNTLPINLSISNITPLDADGEPLTGLDPFITEDNRTIAANGTSTLELRLTNNETDDLLQLDGLDLGIHAFIDHIEGGASLKADQSISIKVSARVPHGINVDLNDAM